MLTCSASHDRLDRLARLVQRQHGGIDVLATVEQTAGSRLRPYLGASLLAVILVTAVAWLSIGFLQGVIQ